MPLYPYRCTVCGYKFEKIQSFSAEPETECPKCHGLLKRQLTAPGLHFVGSGWYVNDYAHGGSSSSVASSPSPSPSKEKGEAKTPCGGNCGAACPAVAGANASGSSTN